MDTLKLDYQRWASRDGTDFDPMYGEERSDCTLTIDDLGRFFKGTLKTGSLPTALSQRLLSAGR